MRLQVAIFNQKKRKNIEILHRLLFIALNNVHFFEQYKHCAKN